MTQFTQHVRLMALLLLFGIPIGFVMAQSTSTESETQSTTIGEKVDRAIESTNSGAVKAKDITVDKSKQAWDAIKQGTAKAGEWTTDKSKKAWTATKSTAGVVSSKIKELYQDTKEAVSSDRDGEPAPVEEMDTRSSE